MKILLVADHEQPELWGSWHGSIAERMEGVDLVLSAGDISPYYLEFLVTMLNVPLLYVRGNHDSLYDTRPPEGCICIEDKVVLARKNDAGYYEIVDETAEAGVAGLLKRCWRRFARMFGNATDPGNDADSRSGQSGEACSVRIAGLGGSMRYRDGADMYTEEEMTRRAGNILRILRRSMKSSRDAASGTDSEDALSILLTHAPCRGHGDLSDLAHTGFECFNELLTEWQPDYHCHGHIHMEYGDFVRIIDHPCGTTIINSTGYYIIEV